MALAALPMTSIKQASSFYSSKPVGPQDQPDYINAVVELDTELSAYILLDHLQCIEDQQRRVRHSRWAARTLDLDILLYGNEIIRDERLNIPHVEMHLRGFVLLPLYEIAPDCIVPGQQKVAVLLAQVDVGDLEKLN